MAKKVYQKDHEAISRLNKTQYHVTQENGTEAPFTNQYYQHQAEGLYVDIVSGEPLFLSHDKYDSKSGWPSFTRSISQNICEKSDLSHGMQRTEVRSKHADSHLGHVFTDGPGANGLRYCINSAALKFIPKSELKEQGYDDYLKYFEQPNSATERAILAGGCFWGMQQLFDSLDGVLKTRVGYTGGHVTEPSYLDVTSGQSGHAEAVEIIFDPNKISYQALLAFFFKIHAPTTLNQQGNDRGTQYRSAIFYTSPTQQNAALNLIEQANQSGHWPDKLVTTVNPSTTFWPAEDYHQDYLQKNPEGYSCHFAREHWVLPEVNR